MTLPGQERSTTGRRPRRTRVGVVEDCRRAKTIRVRIDRLVKHPKYGKYVKRRSTLHVHDEKSEARPGDIVEVMECRPISRTKSWRLARVLRSAAPATGA